VVVVLRYGREEIDVGEPLDHPSTDIARDDNTHWIPMING
jgi:hypothetical protein